MAALQVGNKVRLAKKKGGKFSKTHFIVSGLAASKVQVTHPKTDKEQWVDPSLVKLVEDND